MNRPMSHARRFMLNAMAFSLFLFALGALGGMMKSCEDHSEEWAVSQSIIDAQVASQQDYRKQKASEELCRKTVGESVPVWDADGNMVCKPKGWMK